MGDIRSVDVVFPQSRFLKTGSTAATSRGAGFQVFLLLPVRSALVHLSCRDRVRLFAAFLLAALAKPRMRVGAPLPSLPIDPLPNYPMPARSTLTKPRMRVGAPLPS